MEIRLIGVKLGKTINLGNYESARVDVEMSAERDLSEDLDGAFDELWAETDKQLKRRTERKEWG